MAYRIFRSPAVTHDLDLIFDHLLQSYISLGETSGEAFDRALRRIELITSDMNTVASAPHQGTGHDRVLPGLRHVTKNRAVFYFHVDDTKETVRILAVFFGGQDHQKIMRRRLWS